MRNTGLEEARAGIKIAGRNINNLRFAVDNGPGARRGVLIRSLGLTDVNYYIQNG